MTESIQAAAVGFYDDWNLEAGADKVTAINSPDDDATSYIDLNYNGSESYTLAASTIPVGSVINSVSVSMRLGDIWGAHNVRALLRLAGTDVLGTLYTPTGWQTFVEALTRPGGGAWTLSDLATLEIGIHGGAAGWMACSTIFAIVDYTPPAGDTGDMMLVF